MFFKRLDTILIALCYLLNRYVLPASAQQCQQDMASAYFNPAVPNSELFFSDAPIWCSKSSNCPTRCAGALPDSCLNSVTSFCTNSDFKCDIGFNYTEATSTYYYNTCTLEEFYYGAYVPPPDFQFRGGSSPLTSIRDTNWPNDGATYSGSGVVQMGDKTKLYAFYHKSQQNLRDFGAYSDPSCYQRQVFTKVNNTLISGNQLPNFGSGQAPSISTCPADTSCPLGDCSYIGGTKCCFDGTCICTKDTSICGDSSKVFTASSTNACQKNPPELFYYGEFLTTLPVQSDSLFFSTLTKGADGWLYAGLMVTDMKNRSGIFRKDMFFLHKYPL